MSDISSTITTSETKLIAVLMRVNLFFITSQTLIKISKKSQDWKHYYTEIILNRVYAMRADLSAAIERSKVTVFID